MNNQPNAQDLCRAPLEKFAADSKLLIGKVAQERRNWNTTVSADAVRHFVLGTSDENPLWFDPDPAGSVTGMTAQVPPAFPLSVGYPVLHGAPAELPLEDWITRISCRWHHPMKLGDRLRSEAKLLRVSLVEDVQGGLPKSLLVTGTDYSNQHGERVASMEVNLFRTSRSGESDRIQRECHRYEDGELLSIKHSVESESRRGDRLFQDRDLAPGAKLPAKVRGPLNIGDLVAWNAAVGPAAASGSWAWRDSLKSPARSFVHPVTGALVSASLQHEDTILCHQRGMPLPFDNGLMRFAWILPLLTDWMGDHGRLQYVAIDIMRPNLYGDTTWYGGFIVDCQQDGADFIVKISIFGTNQLGEKTVRGEASVLIPEKARKSGGSSERASSDGRPQRSEEDEVSLLDRILNHAAEFPDNNAVSDCSGTTVSYGNLVRRIAVLADWLQDSGIRPGSRVAVACSRTVEALIWPLAILRAGGTWIGCDPEWPEKRLQAVFQDASPAMVLGDQESAPHLPQGPWQVVSLESVSLSAVEGSKAMPVVSGTVPAYICYTSGSSGRPAGAVVSRTSFSRYLADLESVFPMTAKDVFAHTASFAFSASVRQLFLPLMLGAHLVIAGSEQRKDTKQIIAWMKQRRITVWDTVPSVWKTVIDVHRIGSNAEGIQSPPPELHYILLTGEPLPWQTVQSWWREWGGKQRIYNLYSQTETAGTVAVLEVAPDPEQNDQFVSIGYPFPGVSLHLVDEKLEDVPDGDSGRILVSSDRLADGYLNGDRDKSGFLHEKGAVRQRFLTGDLAYRDGRGTISVVGREDRRIKRRGFRIDLVEIENQLLEHPLVKSAAVVENRQSAGGRLVAHVESDSLTADQVKLYVQRHLPDYMVPNGFVLHDRLPRTASDKIAYQQLLDVAETDGDQTGQPETTVEIALARLWKKVLNIEEVHTGDNFFDLGGDSLLATVLMAEMEKEFGEIKDSGIVYQFPCLHDMAGCLASGGKINEAIKVKEGTLPALFSFPLRSGNSFYLRHLLPCVQSPAAVHCLQPDIADLQSSKGDDFSEVARRCVAAMRRIQPTGPYLLLGYSFAGLLAFEAACYLHDEGERVDALIMIDTATPELIEFRKTVRFRLRKLLNLLRYPGQMQILGFGNRQVQKLLKRLGRPVQTPSRFEAVPRIQGKYKDFFTAAINEHNFRHVPFDIELIQASRFRPFDIEPTANGWPALCENVQVYPVDTTHGALLKIENAASTAGIVDRVLMEAARSAHLN
ncbi:AMP-binding protein [Desulfofustis glycolicus]|uniref:Amino acid adenylation domain-containing protein n=1 Tax=Desulfofustis glycolicus DSM 9705 TaxID=1121409 RepID=A0A1M5Y6T3_9BACT|nr:AMP-binding protein [Desulfofustis glycolicus]MCB2216850.1 AMP-binding protein [Desulfobulbaceae bacterium]SHI07629.1 amino acid adenylation domain-containing protein [Desulfofustis glycolicus DSM 9705]